MRRIALVTIVIVSIVGLATPAYAHNGKSFLSERLTGPVHGEAPFQFDEAGCSFVHQRYETTIDVSAHKDPTMLIDVCVDFGDNGDFVATGTFDLKRSNGTLHGTVTGTAQTGITDIPVSMTLTVESGTSHLVSVRGTMEFDVIWHSLANEVPPVMSGPFEGLLDANLHR